MHYMPCSRATPPNKYVTSAPKALWLPPEGAEARAVVEPARAAQILAAQNAEYADVGLGFAMVPGRAPRGSKAVSPHSKLGAFGALNPYKKGKKCC